MITSSNPTYKAPADPLTSETLRAYHCARDSAFEAAREPSGACTIERQEIFLTLFMQSFERATAHLRSKWTFSAEALMSRARSAAATWFAKECTPF